MTDAPRLAITRRQFLVGGAAGAAAAWATPKLGLWGRADALSLDEPGDPAAAAAAGAAAAGALGKLPFSDDFDQEFPGAWLTNWSVVRPVQVVGMTPFGTPAPANSAFDTTDFLNGHGMAVAMDGQFGATTGPGRIETVQWFAFPAGIYTLSFQVAGSHHSADPWPASLVASVPGCGADVTVFHIASDGFRQHRLRFIVRRPSASPIVFESGDAPGQAGLVLDNVSLIKGVIVDNGSDSENPDS